jgi:hypothetical protein
MAKPDVRNALQPFAFSSPESDVKWRYIYLNAAYELYDAGRMRHFFEGGIWTCGL